MPSGNELLNEFETKLNAEGSYIMPPPAKFNDEPISPILNGRAWVHETYQSLDGTITDQWCFVRFWDETKTNVLKASFYLRNHNEPTEYARWFENNDPKPPAPEPTFQQQLTAWLQARVADDTIKHFSGVAANEATERATCTIVLNDAGTLVEKRVALWKDAQGNPQYQVITQ